MKAKINILINLNARVLLSLLFLIMVDDLNAQSDYNQNMPNYTLASPDVNNFQKYSLNRANHYVGKLDISLPIYTIKTGRIEYPINLVYNTGGIKVDQIASDVGLGWNLTNSVITRTINQSNDFDSFDSGKIGYFLQKLNSSVIGGYYVDFIPDTYHFYTNGFSTNFFFDDVNTPIEINPTGTKIEAFSSELAIDTKRGTFTNNIWTPSNDLSTKDFFSIIITTNEGIKYTFSDCDYSLFQTDKNAQVSAWHITKIEDLRNGKKIDFIYENTSSNPNHTTNLPPELNVNLAQRSYGYILGSGYSQSSNSIVYNYDLTPSIRVDVQKKRLMKIIFDEGEVDFNYNNIGIVGQAAIVRNDLYNGDCVTQIYLKDTNLSTVKSFNFSYDYFNSKYNVGEFNPDNTNNTYRYNRLKLLKFGETGKPEYKFSYEETTKMPPINSYSIDFLGYYNKSPDKTTLNSIYNDHPVPTLYFYPNNFEKSLLPFNVSSMNPTILPGYFNREANDYAKTWSLNKIEYPTGGSTEYLYESNQFEEFGQNIKGGGIRIAQQKINDGKAGTRTISYSYLKDNGNSSGKLSSMPYFGFLSLDTLYHNGPYTGINYPTDELSPATIVSPLVGPFNNEWWVFFDKSNLNCDIAIGAYVGYSKIKEIESGHGRKEFSYTSNDLLGYQNIIYRMPPQFMSTVYLDVFDSDYIYDPFRLDPSGNPECYLDEGRLNTMIGSSAIFSNIFTDKSYKRGRLLEKKVYSESNQLLNKISIKYTDLFLNKYTYHQGYFETSPLSSLIRIDHSNYLPMYCLTQSCQRALITVKKDFEIKQFLVTTETDSTFNTDGTQSDNTSYFSYNQNGIVNSVRTSTSDGGEINKLYYYANDPQMNNELFHDELVAANIIGVPLKTEVYKGIEKLSETKTVFANDASTNNLPLPKFVYAKKGTDANATLEKKLTYDLYDDKGNILQFTQESGVSNVIIWGYNKTEPIAEIQNIAYSNITSYVTNLQSLSNADNDTCTSGTCNEQLLRNALNSLRTTLASSYPNARMTTYTYNPLIGVTSVTDAKSDVQYYIYDSIQRLIKVIDKDGKIVSEKEYNYKPQN